MIALDDLLKARARNLDAEQRRERVLRVRFPFPSAPRGADRDRLPRRGGRHLEPAGGGARGPPLRTQLRPAAFAA